jgi:hypothetical protein
MRAASRPPLFQEGPFEAALERSTAEGLLLVVSVTTQADAASRAMDDATWRREEVRAWVEGRALAVQLDLDVDRQAARTLNVRAVPTTIVLRAGKQEERLVGFRDAAEMSAWLAALAQRERKPDPYLRDSAASLALADQRYGEATTGYVWLWNNIPGFADAYEAGWMGSRRSFLLQPLESLVTSHPPAHEAFSAIRDASGAAAPALDLGDWFGPRVDWLVLNRLLGQQDRTLGWFDGVKADPPHARVIAHCASVLLQPLKESQRWADIGRLFPEPLVALAELRPPEPFGSQPSHAGEDEPSVRVRRRMMERFRADVSVLYAGLRAAGRASDAKAVREEACRLDPSDEMRRALEQAPASYN